MYNVYGSGKPDGYTTNTYMTDINRQLERFVKGPCASLLLIIRTAPVISIYEPFAEKVQLLAVNI